MDEIQKKIARLFEILISKEWTPLIKEEKAALLGEIVAFCKEHPELKIVPEPITKRSIDRPKIASVAFHVFFYVISNEAEKQGLGQQVVLETCRDIAIQTKNPFFEIAFKSQCLGEWPTEEDYARMDEYLPK